MDFDDFKAGFVSIIGRPNVGKSTLMNRLIGEKLSIVSPKPQTTRMNVKGFVNSKNSQIVFLDTPGFLEPRYELHEKMQSCIQNSIKKSEVIIFLTDSTDFPRDYDEAIIDIIKKSKKRSLGVLNKADLCTKEQLITKKNQMSQHFEMIFVISAKNDSCFSELLEKTIECLPKSPPLYDKDDLSDMPMRFFAQEIIREKIFLSYGEEIPYSSTVVVEKWTEEDHRDVIQANIWIERDSQKSILIGKNGTKIGEIRRDAEIDIAKLTGKKAVLNLWVKVKKDWRKKKGALHEFGYK